ncbi:MAG TPA: ABC transporter substrate-binding protein [Vicinamibacterales bacterium]|nr:ABC transporter substrate-binding protein [Vicinamibacterales bacterium]
MASAVLCVLGCVTAAGCARGRSETVRIAIGGQNQLIYLPTTLARELGFYRDEGLDVELQDFQGGAKALQAAVGGSAEIVSGFYDHTIQMAADGKSYVAFVTMTRFPGLVLATSPKDSDHVTRVEDLRGRVAGVTTAGSSSQMLLNYLLHRHGVPLESVSVTSIGSAATAIAAMEHGTVAAGMMADPAFTLLVRRNTGVHVLADLRTGAGVRDAFGASSYPGAVIYASADWIGAHRDAASRVARAIVRALSWMQSHQPADIAAKAPKEFRGDDDALYAESIRHSMTMFSPDGVMSADGAEAVHRLLAESVEKVRTATIDLSRTYTNDFINGR